MTTPSRQAARTRTLTGDEDFNGLTHAEPSLPGHWYHDPEVYRRELEMIFYRHWIFLCHADALDQPRAFRRFTIGDQEIFLVRNDHGELRGFHNTCRHRGSAICREERGRFSGKLMVCPYHQWAYSLDGELVRTSSHAEGVGFDRRDYPLLEVRIHEWRGAIFACLGDDPPDIADSFARGGDYIESWPMQDLVVGHTWTEHIECNWKIFWENFNECLHCPNVHPELCELVPMYGRGISNFRDHAHWREFADDTDPAYAGGLRPGAVTWSYSGEPAGAVLPGLDESEIARGQSYFVTLPSAYIAAHADYMRTVRILPLGPERTELSVEWLFPEDTLLRDDFDVDEVTGFAKMVLSQDAEVSELNQRGVRSNRFERGVLMPEEHHVKAFQDWVRREVGEAG